MQALSSLVLLGALTATVAAQGFDPPTAPDLDPDPNVVEVQLTAAVTTWQFVPGIDTTVWTYNDSTPGPTIVGEVGQTLRVRFTNQLPQPTTIHWHGVEITAPMDGSHISQRPVAPGESFVYEFPLLREGLYWYHPHVSTFHQVEMGLHGCLLVRAPLAQRQALGLTDRGGQPLVEEHVVVFDDVMLDTDPASPNYMQIMPAFPYAGGVDPLKNADYHTNGRIGTHLLVNGKLAGTTTLMVPAGTSQRWRVINVANSTFCRLDLNDAATGMGGVDIWEIGSDGGFESRAFKKFAVQPTRTFGDHPEQTLLNHMGQGITLLPAERVDVVFTPTGAGGQVFTIQQKDWFRGRHMAIYGPTGSIMLPDDPLDGFYPDQPYFKVQLIARPGPVDPLPWVPLPRASWEAAVPFPPPVEPTKTVKVTFGHAPPDAAGDVTFFSLADFSSGSMRPIPAAKVTSFDAPDLEVGDQFMWEVTNLTHGDHPFHVHGFFFELVEYEWIDDLDPTLNLKWQPTARRMFKDVIRAPARLGGLGTSRCITRLVAHVDDTGRQGQISAEGETATFAPSGAWTSGGWLMHCHILEHSGKGMLAFFEVRDPAAPIALLGRHLDGTQGKASLTANSTFLPGSTLNLDLVNALPCAPAVLIAGDAVGRLSLFGGEIVPGGGFIGLPTSVGCGGEITFGLDGWDLLPPGAELYFQYAIADAGAPQGLALSNALRFRRP
ncbi:MAG: multicopper oxidase family protein [Planctomycetota bacterium]